MIDQKPPAPEHDHGWNRRKERSPLPFFLALGVFCLIIAYFLSHTAR